MIPRFPIEVYHILEKSFGREDARRVVEALEEVIGQMTNYKWATTKEELLNAIRGEFVTKELFTERLNGLKTELEGRIEHVKTELEGRIELVKEEMMKEVKRLDAKLNFLIILLILALTLMNPVVAEVIQRLWK